MSNAFIQATATVIDQHGTTCTFSSVQEGTYDVNTATTTTTTTDYTIKTYMKQLRATQFNYPSLVGKEAAMFYVLAYGLAFVPAPKDLITIGAKVFTVDSVQSHSAGQETVLYRILAAK